MVTLYMLIGQDSFFLYEKTDRRYRRRYIEGSPSFPYDPRRVGDAIKELLKALENEYNLDGPEGIALVLIENRDPDRTKVVKDALGDRVVEVRPLEGLLQAAVRSLRQEKKERIDQLGINFDGAHYTVEGGRLREGLFSLLAYPLGEDELMEKNTGDKNYG